MRPKTISTILMILALAFALLPHGAARAATISVNTLSDENDGSCSDGDCSLRDAIIIANTLPGADTIAFDIAPGLCMGGICTFYPMSLLPALSGGDTTIDGYTQPGAQPATATDPALILIQIDGRNTSDCDGLDITSSGNVVRGISIHSYDWNGIAIGLSTASGNVIEGNYVGVGPGGVVAPGNELNGVFVGLGAHDNTIGGNAFAKRNVISGNGWSGVAIHGAETSSNLVVGNYIGTDETGMGGLGNVLDGVWIYGGSHDNTVGGMYLVERNVIADNGRSGVRIYGEGTHGNVVNGNFIGTDQTGTAALGNTEEGVYIGNGAQSNLIGGDILSEKNVVSGNHDSGIFITGAGTISNTVSGNYIGTDLYANFAVGNSGTGVYILDASGNLIGGDEAGERNVISGNYDGIAFYGSEAHDNGVTGNYIGLNREGDDAIPNTACGVAIMEGAHHNLIGGDTPAWRNVISGNEVGIFITGAGTASNTVAGNYIGTDPSASIAVGNTDSGVYIANGAQSNLIGGDTPGERNVISGNHMRGVMLAEAQNNQVSGNYIGVTSDGGAALGNLVHGVLVSNASSNVIGGAAPGEGNIISGNSQVGVMLQGSGTSNNVVNGNIIGADATGRVPLGEQFHGVVIQGSASGNTIGGPTSAERNVIYGNANYGVGIWDVGTNENVLMGNSIGVDVSGGGTPYNYGMGVVIENGAQENWVLGGVISQNGADGIYIGGITTTGNFVSESRIYANDWQGINLVDGANGDIQAPGIVAVTRVASGYAITGKTCRNCIVEVYASRNNDGEGELYLGSTVATFDGDFALTVIVLPFPYLTTTARDGTLGTSEFSDVFVSPYHFVFLPLARK